MRYMVDEMQDTINEQKDIIKTLKTQTEADKGMIDTLKTQAESDKNTIEELKRKIAELQK